MEQWECHFCTGFNDSERLTCWNCSKDYSESAKAPGSKLRMSAEREQLAEARAASLDVATKAANHEEAKGNLDLRGLLLKFSGAEIGVNALDPTSFMKVRLLSVQSDHFVVSHREGKTRVPFTQILRITEAANDDEEVSTGFFGGTYPLVIEIFHMIVYKGGLRVGFAIPIGS